MRESKSNNQNTSSLVFTVTTPTQELRSGAFIEALIQPHTTYQIIPAPLALNYEAEQVLLSALPLTKYSQIHLETSYLTSLCHSQSLIKPPMRPATWEGICCIINDW